MNALSIGIFTVNRERLQSATSAVEDFLLTDAIIDNLS